MHRAILFGCFALLSLCTAYASKPDDQLISHQAINALVFDQPILQVNYPAGQLQAMAGSSERKISYVNKNKTMLFFPSKRVSHVQFMVTLLDGEVMPLRFGVASGNGKLINIVSKHHHRGGIDQTTVMTWMRSVSEGYSPGQGWHLFHFTTHWGTLANVSILAHNAWKKGLYRLVYADACYKDNVAIDDFMRRLKQSKGVLAITRFMSKTKMLSQQCQSLWLLYREPLVLTSLNVLHPLSVGKSILHQTRQSNTMPFQNESNRATLDITAVSHGMQHVD